MAVVGVLALQGSYNEHMSGTPNLLLAFLARVGDVFSRDSVGFCLGSAEEDRSEGGRGAQAGAAAGPRLAHHPRR